MSPTTPGAGSQPSSSVAVAPQAGRALDRGPDREPPAPRPAGRGLDHGPASVILTTKRALTPAVSINS